MSYQVNEVQGLEKEQKEVSFLTNTIWTSWGILFVCVLYQLIVFSEITNIIAMVAVAFSWLITTKIWMTKEMLGRYLISTFMIIGFTASQFYFPLLFTTIENKPLIYNLELPEEVFLHASAALVVLALAHALYRFLMKVTINRSVSILERVGLYEPPTYLQLWIMGFIGMASSFYVHFAAPDIGHEVTGEASDKAVQALVPFMYAPFFIGLGKLFGNNTKPPKASALLIAIYSVFLFAISIARNSRGAFIFGLTTPAFAYLLGLLLGVFKTRILSLRNFVMVGSVVWLLMGPLSDLGVAMINVRGNAESLPDIPPAELIMLTLDALDDKEAIERRKAEDKDASLDPDWDERYLDNIFTARFSNIKFNDSNLITYSKVGTFDPDMQEYSLDHLIASLPDPIIKLFNFDVDKESTLLISYGDFLYVLSGGFGWPAGLRVGHMAGTGMAAFGWWYLLLLGLVVIPVFYVNDKYFRVRRNVDLATTAPQDRYLFSFCGVLLLTSFFQFLTFESVVEGVTYLIRGWTQTVLLYLVLFHFSRVISRLVTRPKRKLRFAHN